MQTTATSPARTAGPGWASRAVLRTVGPVAVAAVATTAVGGVVEGRPAALGAFVGGFLLVVVLATSSFVLDAVASLANAPVLLVSLLTYTLHLALVLLALLAVDRSGLGESTLSMPWLGGAIIVAALVWSVVQIVVTTRLRIPIYDLPERSSAPADGAGA